MITNFIKNNPLLFFFLKLFLIWISWKGFIIVIGEEAHPLESRMFPAISAVWEDFNDFYRTVLLQSTEMVLKVMNYETTLSNNYKLKINGYGGVAVGNYCLGFQLMYYFSMLVLVAEMSKTRKTFGIVAGLIIVFVLNVMRIAGLNLMSVYCPSLLAFTHDYVFNFGVFGVLLILYNKFLI